MKEFKYLKAGSLEEAKAAMQSDSTRMIAGGTDMLGALKNNIYPDYPETIIDLKSIPGLEYIREENGYLKIGAMTRLDDIAKSNLVKTKYRGLAMAAEKTASYMLRKMGTIAGNICQNNRCWYFWGTDNFFHCLRKEGGDKCFAFAGEHIYHTIFGPTNKCGAVNPSDTAPALVALDAEIVTTDRVIPIDEFFAVGCETSTVLKKDEIVTEIRIPQKNNISAFVKYAERKTIDFPIVNCAVSIVDGEYRICMNAVYGVPKRATAAEELLRGRFLTEELIEEAGKAAVSDARPLKNNKYKVEIAQAMVKRALAACM